MESQQEETAGLAPSRTMNDVFELQALYRLRGMSDSSIGRVGKTTDNVRFKGLHLAMSWSVGE